MVQPRRVDPSGYGPLLRSDPGLRGPSGFGSGPALEARWLASVSGSESLVSGHIVHGAVPHQPPAAPRPATRPLLRLVLSQIRHSAAARRGAGAGTDSPFHSQKERVVETVQLAPLTETLKH